MPASASRMAVNNHRLRDYQTPFALLALRPLSLQYSRDVAGTIHFTAKSHIDLCRGPGWETSLHLESWCPAQKWIAWHALNGRRRNARRKCAVTCSTRQVSIIWRLWCALRRHRGLRRRESRRKPRNLAKPSEDHANPCEDQANKRCQYRTLPVPSCQRAEGLTLPERA